MKSRKLLITFIVILSSFTLYGGAACSRGEQPEAVAATPNASISPTPTPGDRISIAAVGDIMLGSTYQGRGLPEKDGAEMISGLAPILSATDIAFGNLEGPMTDTGESTKCGPNSRFCYTFRVPTRYGKYLKEVGFDVMSLANNHSSDFGAAGRDSSRRALEELGILHAGNDVNDVAYMTVKGRKIALLAFATNPVSLNLIDIDNSRRVVAEAARKVDIVIVSFHGGAEGSAAQHVPQGSETYLGGARGNLRAFTHAVIDAGADLVLGHGPHVLRAMEVYKGRLIAYSLGNFAFYRFPFAGPTALSVILETEIGPQGEFLGGKIHPLMQQGQSGPRLDKNGTAVNVIRQLSKDDFGPTAVNVAADGTISAP
ncbi:MAG TPA: CapA family protein [Pyrinomonadaceae bacterium]